MKKKSILLFFLLSAQLYGCSNNQLDQKEIVLPMTELSESINQADEEKADVYSQTEENNAIRDNTVDTSQNISPEPEESNPITDNDYYRAATSISSAEVEQYAAQVRQQFLGKDWSAIASEISYPIIISDITYETSEDFLNASGSFDSNLDDAFLSAIEHEDCVEMFCNYEGIMIGESGQIWISEVLNDDFTSQGLKITAINGMLEY